MKNRRWYGHQKQQIFANIFGKYNISLCFLVPDQDVALIFWTKPAPQNYITTLVMFRPKIFNYIYNREGYPTHPSVGVCITLLVTFFIPPHFFPVHFEVLLWAWKSCYWPSSPLTARGFNSDIYFYQIMSLFDWT